MQTILIRSKDRGSSQYRTNVTSNYTTTAPRGMGQALATIELCRRPNRRGAIRRCSQDTNIPTMETNKPLPTPSQRNCVPTWFTSPEKTHEHAIEPLLQNTEKSELPSIIEPSSEERNSSTNRPRRTVRKPV